MLLKLKKKLIELWARLTKIIVEPLIIAVKVYYND
jgi:hypothetical protein